jgi:GH15 family glucan-1,4-alpha-glucosidase
LGDFPLGQLEAAFLPCTFWLATAYAKAGNPQKAEAIVQSVERIAGPLGIFAEAVDPRNNCFLGNTPLLFSHVEYIRAKMEIERVRQSLK